MTSKRILPFVAMLIIINLFLNIRTLNYSFIEDDYLLIANNNRIKNINLLVRSIKTPFFKATEHPYLHYWRPAVLFSYYIDYKIWGINPRGFHLTNILLHTINIILFFLLLFFLTGKENFSILSAIIFSIHPSHVESVSWISGRTDILATLFLLLTTLFLYLAIKHKKRGLPLFLFSVLIFPFALLSKEIAVVFPLTIFIFFTILKKIKKGFLISIPFGLITLAYIFIHAKFSKAQTLFNHLKISDMNIILKTTGIYFKLIFFPFIKAPLYSMKTFDKELILPFIFFIAFVILIFLIVKERDKFKTSFYSIPILFFLIPIINPRIISSYPPIALRFIYLSSFFGAILMAETIFLLFENKKYRWFIIIFFFLFTGYLYKYFYFQGFYKNGYTRAEKLVKSYSEEGIYKIQLSMFYAKQKNYEAAINLIEEGIRESKNSKWINIETKGKIFKANLLILTGKSEEAEKILSDLLKSSDQSNTRYYCYLVLSKLYEKKRDYNTALSYLIKGEKLFKTADLYFRKSLIYYYLGDYAKALNSLEKAKRINPTIKNYSPFKKLIKEKLKKVN